MIELIEQKIKELYGSKAFYPVQCRSSGKILFNNLKLNIMKTSKFYIGKFKNGQDFATILDYFGHSEEKEAVDELVKMYKSTEFDEDDFDGDLSEESLREHRQFSQDTTNYGIFELSEDEETGKLEAAITRTWGGRNFDTNQI
ncbi:hypothetical protein [Sunxiuqinia indica]|uniref:hypothetical protein n=1 Tax=Sunxiuqinia indica TaxID=2692584 RepID=UPI001358A0E4|nr:hypothetical protein [Sunxiuqinia indica]